MGYELVELREMSKSKVRGRSVSVENRRESTNRVLSRRKRKHRDEGEKEEAGRTHPHKVPALSEPVEVPAAEGEGVEAGVDGSEEGLGGFASWSAKK